MDQEAIFEDKEIFADVLYREERLPEVLRLIGGMGINSSHLAGSIDVQADTVDNWLNSSSETEIEDHSASIQVLQATTLYLLRRGILPPRALALWLVEPREELQDRSPLSVLPLEGGQDRVIQAAFASDFLRPEPLH